MRNNAGGVQDLSARVALPLIVVEYDTGGPMQLANDNALGTIDNE